MGNYPYTDWGNHPTTRARWQSPEAGPGAASVENPYSPEVRVRKVAQQALPEFYIQPSKAPLFPFQHPGIPGCRMRTTPGMGLAQSSSDPCPKVPGPWAAATRSAFFGPGRPGG